MLNLNSSHISEILVVVLGVLIALFINNINENRKRKRRISGILDVIKENMRQDIDKLNKEFPIIDNKADLIGRLIGGKIKIEELTPEEKIDLHAFLFAYPQVNFIKKEGYRLLRDADFDYNIKKDKILSEIIGMYESNILNLERELGKFIRLTERNCINYIQDDWLYYNKSKYWNERKVHPSIENFLKHNLESSNFLNEVDYLAQVTFGTFRGALEQYRNDLEKSIKLIEE